MVRRGCSFVGALGEGPGSTNHRDAESEEYIQKDVCSKQSRAEGHTQSFEEFAQDELVDVWPRGEADGVGLARSDTEDDQVHPKVFNVLSEYEGCTGDSIVEADSLVSQDLEVVHHQS
mmetsp:Transcript_7964/g.11813  ORF Transcript_7964/g.11813 Transcript_7964/m.11813 type:complete len:118 (-) Transcript_7964:983-1336(-)